MPAAVMPADALVRERLAALCLALLASNAGARTLEIPRELPTTEGEALERLAEVLEQPAATS